MEKQIDEVCRMLADYIVTGNSDVRLVAKLDDLFFSGWANENDISYFIQSFRRELREPEVMNRDEGSIAVYHKANYNWSGY